MSEQKHTPTPWTQLGSYVKAGRFVVCETTAGGYGGNLGEQQEYRQGNAEFIVRAVNSHDQLVAALKLVDDAMTEAWSYIKDSGGANKFNEAGIAVSDALAAAGAA